MAILSNLTKRCVLCKFNLRIGSIVNKKLKIGVWISFFCFKIQNIKFKILNGRTVHGPLFPSPQPHLSRTEETIILTIRDIVVFLASFGRSFAISSEFAWFIYACIPSGESSTCSKSTPNSRKKYPRQRIKNCVECICKVKNCVRRIEQMIT